jgi:hypothetical protein
MPDFVTTAALSSTKCLYMFLTKICIFYFALMCLEIENTLLKIFQMQSLQAGMKLSLRTNSPISQINALLVFLNTDCSKCNCYSESFPSSSSSDPVRSILNETRFQSSSASHYSLRESASAHCKRMQYRKLGHTGLDVSLISFGSWVSFDYQLDVVQAKEIMQACYESGVNFVSDMMELFIPLKYF